ncbi:MAG TPA: hypothetical protein VK126_01895 [Nitrososphaerales archaeon]|nr:hypothetical protein [Nitrososphaerales archaeon]
MKKVQAVVSVLLIASAAVGIEVLRTDGWLWSAAPLHAYGLIAFVALDLLLAGISWRVTRLAIIGSALFGGIQFIAMVGDVFMGQPAGIPAAVWESYLLGDTPFMVLLGIQVVIIAWAILSTRIMANHMLRLGSR